ncbi:MAG: class I SAM-dependent methyltransferase [Actinomycetes bacterium]
MTTATETWARELAAWTIDPAILAAAPEPPYTFPPGLFRVEHSTAASPLLDRAREALRPGDTVLDVGAGAGAASLPLAPPAARVVAVDTQPSMLDALEADAARLGVAVTRIEGQWPEAAAETPVCDVAVCSHVAYNVPALGPFAVALAAHARRRVVLELHATHPWVDLGPLWQQIHGQPRPAGPTAELALAVLREHGIDPQSQEWERPAPVLEGDQLATYVAFTRRRLCVSADREPEVAAYLAAHPPQPRRSVVLWWDT